ncbi:S-layer homology domain-containing protein [Paenibacillus oryzisoli]|uniref:S-layer homology domain-containing protein n=1 Tax=Paenibacillus oryzisoli TaxID=1850517 RepID=UPI003D2D679E
MLIKKGMSLLLVFVIMITLFVPQTVGAVYAIDNDSIPSTGAADEADSVAMLEATGGPATIQNYPMPSIYTQSDVYSLKADDETIPVIQYLPEYDYAEFSFSGTVSIEVTANKPITSYSISPLAKNIQGTVDGNKLTFTLSTSTYVVVDINEDPNENADESDPAKIRKRLVIAADPLETEIPASSGPGIYNVTAAPYNADNTGATITSGAIQQAIDDAYTAGGGTVFIPAGVYTSSNLTLKSNVTFYLAGGAVIVGTGRGEDYRNDFRKDSISDGTYFIRTEVNSENITMRGRGTIDGKGVEMRKRKMTNPPPTHKNGEGFINNLLVPIATSNFTFDGLTLRDGGFWAFLVVRSDHVTITNYKGYQNLHVLEDDAIDINESQDVLVKHAMAISDDDTFSTKTWPQLGMSKNWPGAIEHLENVVFDDALAWSRTAAFKLGMGICTPQINVTIRNSYVYQSARALLVDHAYTSNPLPEEGYAQNVTFENIDIERVGINQFGNYWFRVSTSTSGDVKNILFKNINVRQTGGTSQIQGNPTNGGMVDGLTFTNVYVKGQLARSLSDLKASVRNENVKGVVIANTTPPIFSDDFETGDTEKWTSFAGNWTVQDDNGNGVLSSWNQTKTSLITANAGASWTDYSYEARTKLPFINGEENGGLLFRVQDENNFYMYRINAKSKKLELFKSINGTMTAVAETPFTPAKMWYSVKVDVQGNTVKAYVDGVLMTNWTNPAQELTTGGVGFRTTSAKVLFDDAFVSAINEAPTDIMLSNDLVVENTTAGSTVGTFSTVDPDDQDIFSYVLVAGEGDTDNNSFSIPVLGNTLVLRTTTDYETKDSYSIRVRSTDSGGLYVEKSFIIHITDLDETPVDPTPKAILFSDDFEDGNSTGWSKSSGTWGVLADNDTQALTQKASTTAFITAGESWTDYMYEAKMKLPISDSNAGIIFRVKDSNNYYMYRINSSSKKLELFKAVDGVLTNVSSSAFTAVTKQWYTVKVIIQGNIIRGYVDGELKTVWTNPVTELTEGKIGFRTTTANVLYDDVSVSSLNNAPTNITLTNDSIPENTAPGSSVGTFSTVDPDTEDTFTYELVAGTGDDDNSSFIISGNTLQTVTPFLYDAKNSYWIRVKSTDGGGLSTEKQFTIFITAASDDDSVKADAANNTVTLDRSRVAAGDTVTITAEGDRQSMDGSLVGDEKFIPTNWSSTETGKSDSFNWNADEGAYTSSYTALEVGTHTVTATFQKMSWNGSSWMNGATDTKTVTLQVYAPINQAGNSLSVYPSQVVVGQSVTLTAEGGRQNVTPTNIGDERYYPATWSSSETGKSGVFTVTDQVYQSYYTPSLPGVFTITATYQKQVWNGTAWVNDVTDTAMISLTVNAAPSEDNGGSGNDSSGSDQGTTSPPATGNPDANSNAQQGDKTVTTVSVDPSKLEQTLSQEGKGATLTIPVNTPSDVVVVELTGQMIKSMEAKEAVLEIKTGNATYKVPAALININAVSQELGSQAALDNLKINITISTASAQTEKAVQDTASQNGYQIVVKPVSFEITGNSDGKTVEVSKFNGYVERTIALPDGADQGKLITGVVLNADGTFSPVPTTTTVIDGKRYAKISSMTNSIYAVINSPKAFADVNAHWAKEAVNDMASRLIIDGTGVGRFEPDRDMTRAEFAAMIVKGLGLLRPGTGKDLFMDVTKGSWYYDAVATAYEYGIIDGYGSGIFGPADRISREQAMTMAARAMKLTGLKVELQASEAEALLAGFEDADSSSDFARSSIATSIKSGIITGRDSHLLAPKSNITRAEVAVIIRRLLQKSGLI